MIISRTQRPLPNSTSRGRPRRPGRISSAMTYYCLSVKSEQYRVVIFISDHWHPITTLLSPHSTIPSFRLSK